MSVVFCVVFCNCLFWQSMRMPKCVKKSAPKMGNSTSATINVQVKGCSKDGRVKYSIVDPAVRIGDPFAALRTSRLWEF